MRYSLPTTIEDAVALAQRESDHAYIAGGTDMMVQRAQGTKREGHLIDVSRIAALRGVELGEDSVAIGAGVTLASLIRHAGVRDRFPALVEAARSIASPPVRTSATVGGNLLCENRCVYFDQSEFWRNALGYCLKCDGEVCVATGGTKNCYSVFISDLAPVLIALDARLELAGPIGRSVVSLESIYSGDGVHPRTVPAGALLCSIVIPVAADRDIFFAKLRPRASVDFTNLTVAVRRSGDTLVAAASGVGPAPAVARVPVASEPEALVAGLLSRTKVIDNLPFKRVYRRDMLRTLVARGLERVAAAITS